MIIRFNVFTFFDWLLIDLLKGAAKLKLPLLVKPTTKGNQNCFKNFQFDVFKVSK
jgi:hypothetical protein